MRVHFSLLVGPALALLAACGGDDGGGAATVQLISPAPGAYRATLMGYTVQNCDASLTQPKGVLDSAVRLDVPMVGTYTLSGGLLWSYGAVTLRPGDPHDAVQRLAWRADADVQTNLSGCAAEVTATFLYFPATANEGSLQVDQHFTATSACQLNLPCENLSLWAMTHIR